MYKMRKLTLLPFLALFCLLSFSSCERDTVTPTSETGISSPEGRRLKCPPTTFALSPCDRGFRVSATYNGSPVGFTYPYTITNVATGIVEDSGTIIHNQTTTQVLSHCTLYEVSLYDPCGSVTTILTLYSDGCNNTFLC